MRQRERHGGDPLDRFLANLRQPNLNTPSSLSSSSSTPLTVSSQDNTLSDMASIARDESLSGGEVRERERKSSTPLRLPRRTSRGREGNRKAIERDQKSIGEGARSAVPYHQKFPLKEAKSASPGEVGAEIGERRRKKSDLTVSFACSAGELHPDLHKHPEREARRTLARLVTAASPGEMRAELSTGDNRTRDGIDVIRISQPRKGKQEKGSGASQDDTSFLSHSFPSSLSDPPSFTQQQHQQQQQQQQQSVRRRLRVSSELQSPADIVTVSPAPHAQQAEREDTSAGLEAALVKVPTAERGGDGQRAASDKACVEVVEMVELPAEVETSPDATIPPPLESLLQTSSSSPDTSPSPPLPLQSLPRSPSPAAKPPLSGQVAKSLVQDPQRSSSNDLRLFWDSPTPLASPPHVGEERVRETATVSPRTQLMVSVPTATASAEKEEESQLTSPAPSPAYSSDFDFSSVSQPTLTS